MRERERERERDFIRKQCHVVSMAHVIASKKSWQAGKIYFPDNVFCTHS